jgi:hypothetical protein
MITGSPAARPMHDHPFDLALALADYRQAHPAEPATPGLFLEFLASSPQSFERAHVPGHFTGSAWLVSADGQRVLLTHHRKLGRWLQLGGHADGDPDLAGVALREAGEESGLAGLRVERAVCLASDSRATLSSALSAAASRPGFKRSSESEVWR